MGQGIEFQHIEWREAIKLAEKENKIIFIDAYTSWCGPCKKMAKYEFVKEDVGEFFNDHFINLKLDMESKDGRKFDAQYPVSAYPTLIFMDAKGNVVKREKGARKGHQLIAMGKAVLGKYDFSEKYEEGYVKGNRDFDLVLNYIKSLNQSGKSSLKVANDYLDSDPDITEQQRLDLIYEAAEESDSKIFAEMQKNKKKVISSKGEIAYNKKVRKACLSTIDKAVEFEADFLYEEALLAAKESLTDGYDEFKLDAELRYAQSSDDKALLLKAVKKAGKKYKDDVEGLQSVMSIIRSNDLSDPQFVQVYTDIAKSIYDSSKSDKDFFVYVKALIQNQETKKAKKLLEKKREEYIKADKNTKIIESLLYRLQ